MSSISLTQEEITKTCNTGASTFHSFMRVYAKIRFIILGPVAVTNPIYYISWETTKNLRDRL